MKHKDTMYISSCSFGKDSVATILLALENGEPLDRVVFAEVMFDHSSGISGEIPEHIEWVYSTAIPVLQKLGVVIDVVRSERDYVSYFSECVRSGKYKGKIYGFPIAGRCVINRDCKIKPIREYYKRWRSEYDIVQYVGIASDEPLRLCRLKHYQVSLLSKYDVSESMAYTMCKEAGLLSPIYNNSMRGGCWFCPNSRMKQLIAIRRDYPIMWQRLRDLSKTANLCSYGFRYGKTLSCVEREMDVRETNDRLQLSLF